MATDDKQAQLKQRLQAMGVMQADETSATSTVAPASKDSGFSGLAIMMIIAATLTGLLIYWLTVNSTMHENMDHSSTYVDMPAGKSSTSAEPAHTQMMPSSSEPANPAGSTASNSTTNQADSSVPPVSRPISPANSYTYRPAYPAYRAYPYPPAPPRYAMPPYPRYNMAPPRYPYPPAPWPPRR